MTDNGVERTMTDYDTREKLEADVREYLTHGGKVAGNQAMLAATIVWLDRQAAITERTHAVDNLAIEELRKQVDELTAKHQNDYDAWQLQMDELTAERDRLREAVDALEAGTMWAKYREVCDERDRLQRVVRIQAESFKALEREIADLKAAAASGGQPQPNAQDTASDGLKTPAKADLVAVTRCRDCRRAERYGGELVCKLKSCAWYAVDADGFCSQGVQRAGGQ